MSTKTYHELWKYEPGATELRYINEDDNGVGYISLPVNSEFKLPADNSFYILYANNTTKYITNNNVSLSAADMTTIGWQTLTATYVHHDGRILTCSIRLHVYGDSTWRTLWEGQDQIQLKGAQFGYKLWVNGEISDWYGRDDVAVTCQATDKTDCLKYVGADAPRTIRITLASTYNNEGYENCVEGLYAFDQKAAWKFYTNKEFVGSYDKDEQWSGYSDTFQNFNNRYKMIAMNCYYDFADTHPEATRQQCLFGWLAPQANRLGLENDEDGNYYWFIWNGRTYDINGDVVSTDYNSVQLTQQNITIKKIEVKE